MATNLIRRKKYNKIQQKNKKLLDLIYQFRDSDNKTWTIFGMEWYWCFRIFSEIITWLGLFIFVCTVF